MDLEIIKPSPGFVNTSGPSERRRAEGPGRAVSRSRGAPFWLRQKPEKPVQTNALK